jgi:hypothetical protein
MKQKYEGWKKVKIIGLWAVEVRLSKGLRIVLFSTTTLAMGSYDLVDIAATSTGKKRPVLEAIIHLHILFQSSVI